MRALLIALALAAPAHADTVVALRTIPAGAVVGAADVGLAGGEASGGAVAVEEVVGLEARVALYAGRTVHLGDLGPPAVVERNQVVALIYQAGAVLITAEGRTLDRGGAGEVVRVMNLASRTTVSARLGADGAAYVSP